mgnify:CR=1 FL=1
MNIDLMKYLDMSLFVPKVNFRFNKACYYFMVDILGLGKIWLDLLRDAKHGMIVDLRLWKTMKQRILLMGDQGIYLKDSPNLRIP